ncbi:MAG: hypothetical protein HY320_03905, partial [Armatimonadetes bacterium]|nr:hypothetical protein [Armatimonadota bacterium]
MATAEGTKTAPAGITPAGAMGTMTNRQRVLAIMDRKSPDWVPWIPRLEIWYTARVKTGTMPPEYQGYSLRQLEQAMGIGNPARRGRIYKVERPGVETIVHRNGRESVLEHRTPLGSVY